MKKTFTTALKILLFATPFTVLVVPSGLFFPFITGKAFLFRLLIDIAFGIYLGLILVDPESRPHWSFRKNILLYAVGALTLVALLADLFAPFPFKAFWSNFERMEGFVTIIHLAVFFVMTSAVFKSKDWRNFFLISIGLGVYLAFYAGLQMSGIIPIDQGGGGRIDTTLGNAAYCAIFFAFQAFFVLMEIVRSKEKRLIGIAESVAVGSICFFCFFIYQIAVYKTAMSGTSGILMVLSVVLPIGLLYLRYFLFYQNNESRAERITTTTLYTVLFVIFSILVIETQTRGTTLGLMGGLLLSAIYILWREKDNKLIRKISLSYIVLFVVVIAGFFALKNSTLVKSSSTLDRFASISLDSASGQARQYIWPIAIKGAFSSPKTSIIGWGQDGFIYVFAKYYDPRLWSQEAWFDRAHNEFLDWLVAGGSLGFLAYLSLYIGAVWTVLHSKRFSETQKGILIGLLAAYAFHNLFVFDNLISYLFFFAILGFIASESDPKPAGSGIYNAELGNILLPIGAIVGIGLMLLVNYKPYEQNVTLISALRVMQPQNGVPYSCTDSVQKVQSDGSVENVCNKSEPTLDVFKKALSYGSLGEAETRQFLLQTALTLDQSQDVSYDSKIAFAQEVIVEYQKQLKENPLFETPYFDYGDYLEGLGLHDQAKDVFTQAEALSPTRQYPYLKLGEIALEEKDASTSLADFKTAYDLDPTYPEAGSAYASALIQTKNMTLATPILEGLVTEDGGLTPDIIETLVSSGNVKVAESLLLSRISAAPHDQTTYVYLASVYLEQKDSVDANNIIAELKANNPELSPEIEQYLSALSSTSTPTATK